VREADKPFANLEYTGIDAPSLEGVEARLKADVLAEAGASRVGVDWRGLSLYIYFIFSLFWSAAPAGALAL
jgi:hypothetical protein